MSPHDWLFRTQNLLGLNHENAQSPEDKERWMRAIEALWFIWSRGHLSEFEEYWQDQSVPGPPDAIAAFKTREEALAWLNALPRSPEMAHVLVADEYHDVIASKDRRKHYLPPSPSIRSYLADMVREGLPPPAASFATREEAQAWLEAQESPPRQSVIQIGGEPYLAAYYRNIPHRALFPFSLADRLLSEPPPEP